MRIRFARALRGVVEMLRGHRQSGLFSALTGVHGREAVIHRRLILKARSTRPIDRAPLSRSGQGVRSFAIAQYCSRFDDAAPFVRSALTRDWTIG